MRALVERVVEAQVTIGQNCVATIQSGLLVYVAVARDDTEASAEWVAEKVRFLRIFPGADGKLNLDVVQVGGELLVVSAFSLHASVQKGRRPGFDQAATGPMAQALYERVCDALVRLGLRVQRGVFGADMQVHSINDGPICILLDSSWR